MRVGIDAGPLLGEGGISRYVGPLVGALLNCDHESEYRLVLRRGWLGQDGARSLDALAPVTRVALPDRLLSFWWNRLRLPAPLHRELWSSLDLFLATCLIAPVLSRGKVVSVVYDLIPLRLPRLFPQRDRFRLQVERIVARSAALIAISQRTREDLTELLAVDPSRVCVVYPGRGETFHPVTAAEAKGVAARYGISGRYVLYVGALGVHKNVSTLLRAYQRARLEGNLAAKLVLVGSQRWGKDTLAVLETLRVRAEVLVAGPVAAEDLPALYSGAELFVFPSLYEGFGLPVLEAMACGTPVIVSDRGALPEVAGDAGIVVNAEDSVALAAAMCRVASDPELRARLSAGALARAAHFSWAKAAEDLLSVLREVGPRRGNDG